MFVNFNQNAYILEGLITLKSIVSFKEISFYILLNKFYICNLFIEKCVLGPVI